MSQSLISLCQRISLHQVISGRGTGSHVRVTLTRVMTTTNAQDEAILAFYSAIKEGEKGREDGLRLKGPHCLPSPRERRRVSLLNQQLAAFSLP